MSYKQLKKYNMKFILAAVACFLLLILLCLPGHAENKIKSRHDKLSRDTLSKVRAVFIMSNKNVYDYNKNGEINCNDHAVLFKIYWDKYYSKDDCIIVRNSNPNNGFSHLFCAVWDKEQFKFIAVETWDDNVKNASYCMHCAWGNMYDAWYNYYDETEYWLKGRVYIAR